MWLVVVKIMMRELGNMQNSIESLSGMCVCVCWGVGGGVACASMPRWFAEVDCNKWMRMHIGMQLITFIFIFICVLFIF